MQGVATQISEFLDTDVGVALTLIICVVEYVALLSITAIVFFSFSRDLLNKLSAIEMEAERVRQKRLPGRPPVDPDLKWFRETEIEVKASDAKIDGMRADILWPIISTTAAAYFIAPIALALALMKLDAFDAHFPSTYAWLHLPHVGSIDGWGAFVFIFESIIRAISFGLLDVLHFDGHLYAFSPGSIALAALVWPLQLSAAAYLYLSIYEVFRLARTLRTWIRERNELAELVRNAHVESGTPYRYDRVGKDRGFLFFSRTTDIWTRPARAGSAMVMTEVDYGVLQGATAAE